jgi:hypothetical protein
MSNQTPISPRQEALDAIKRARGGIADPSISESAWDSIVGIAWENRSQMGDRRETQRDLRDVLLEASREGGVEVAVE